MTTTLRTAAGLAAALLATAVPCQRPRVLLLTHSAGFQHAVVKRASDDAPSLVERALTELVAPQVDVVATRDCGRLSSAELAGFAAVVLYTTGELPVSAEGRRALLDFVRAGGGLVGIHCATDTWYEWPEYGALIGGRFDGHPWHQEVRVVVEDAVHPAVARLAPAFAITDEIYQFRGWSRDDLHVLMRLDPDSVDAAAGHRADRDYALAWCREEQRGRVFYTALGHRPEVWGDRRFLEHVAGGLRWAIGETRLGAPPAGATVLFDGTDTSRWRARRGGTAGWQVDGGVLRVVPGAGDIETVDAWHDFRLHVEFRVPLHPERDRGQARGNSGVYLQRRYEVQILDSAGEPPAANGCAALYGRRAPDVDAARPAGAWQSYDLWFHAPRWDGDAKTADARITVHHNGVLVHDDVALAGKTGAGEPEGPTAGPIVLQDHGSAVEYRNVWLVPLPGR